MRVEWLCEMTYTHEGGVVMSGFVHLGRPCRQLNFGEVDAVVVGLEDVLELRYNTRTPVRCLVDALILLASYESLTDLYSK
jgi:hypothetical protein